MIGRPDWRGGEAEVYDVKPPKTMEDVVAWLTHGVGPAMRMVKEMDNCMGTIEHITEEARLKPRQRAMLAEARGKRHREQEEKEIEAVDRNGGVLVLAPEGQRCIIMGDVQKDKSPRLGALNDAKPYESTKPFQFARH